MCTMRLKFNENDGENVDGGVVYLDFGSGGRSGCVGRLVVMLGGFF